ncbi:MULTISPECIES: hypothetical protein [unclassified Rhizobium]|uniref:hypothetical protein n=1 Tax=unclassified Rhizobium TaxID=2613769 RepID=UPI001A992991|nr:MULTISPECIES: hypothetical protein [unclassified Rhizobium]MBX5165922.1 hypothetical protein [Rhizobium sp. NZLR4b]MBX5174267.1 hypothetical protein [Rhizobium sp. NZLR1b]MBX5184689.1 hypothetical protein [Rhizobium sp. NZLR5]MBX5193393.1 hypothetical protein [Rhizobium sp. NZLR3b]MBX5205290.1 hypothetical protein [Rhizobium sp. NZLR1]
MHNAKFIHYAAFSLGVAIAAFQAEGVMAAPANNKFFDAALCKPPYSMTSTMEIYDAAEALAKPNTSSLGAAIYKIPNQIGRDGFKSTEVFFSSNAVGILVEGERADDLAAKYGLKPESSDLLGTSTKGYSRELPADQQPEAGLAGPGKISIVARQGEALPGKTLLACEFAQEF